MNTPSSPVRPYRIAVLCYLYDSQGRLLLLHRRKSPNRDLYSPIGGKLEQAIGESPTACAQREVKEETGLDLPIERFKLVGMISESEFEGREHWLMFMYDVTGSVELPERTFDEGKLEWHDPRMLDKLAIPDTDRQAIWPLYWRYRHRFFAAHIDCQGGKLACRLEQPVEDGRALSLPLPWPL